LSHLEYALSIIGLLTKKERKEIAPEIKKIEKLINQSCQWACTIPHANKTLASWMINIWSYKTLLTYRQAALQEQISYLPVSNPLRQLISRRSYIPVAIEKDLLSLRTTNSEIYNNFINERNTNPKLKLAGYINQIKKQSVSNSNNVCYTFPSKKNHKSNSDIIFSCKDPKIQRNAICWRQRIVYTESKAVHRNTQLLYKFKHCDKEFSTAHVKECKLITQGKNKNPKLWAAFVNESKEFGRHYPEAKNYTFLDFLLNNRHFKLFQKLYLMINQNLCRKKIRIILILSPQGRDSRALRRG
jgi:hypothetical protein